ncbi:hypothetical protein [Haematobacter genomosp. 1]|uniref:Uncharacterized protein n=1 Tax=Haematobacter genomosp. 1 TaxID=366618 RepID=A0A212ACG8_9RHOB|nr:hypothetical protein [Haematobacter genomosp. 1]OWJ78726.1 hypothetical protein CDV49_06325 [Haematobacter genomosp. 1]
MTIALPFVILLFGAWSLICIAYPLRPFRNRREALLGFVASILGFIFAAVSLMSHQTNPAPTAEQAAVSISDRAAPLPTAVEDRISVETNSLPERLALCEMVSENSAETRLISEAHDLLLAPSADADPVLNERASGLLDKQISRRVIESQPVSVLCEKDGWALVRTMNESADTSSVGWVPNGALAFPQPNTTTVRSIVMKEVPWTAQTKKYRDKILLILNSIARDNPYCRSLDPATLEVSERGTREDPVFFVTCEGGDIPFNIWFRPSDAGGWFGPSPPIERSAAISACEQGARASATHPSTVSFSRFIDVTWTTWNSGRARLASTFTAKNSFNLELKYQISCLFEGNRLLDIQVSEAG